MDSQRWREAWCVLTLDVTREYEEQLWLDDSGVLEHQPELRRLWREVLGLADQEHAVPRLQRLLAGSSPQLYDAVSHWIAHVFEFSGADRAAELIWTSASHVIAVEPSLADVQWRHPFERLSHSGRLKRSSLENSLNSSVESEWDRSATTLADQDRETVLILIGNVIDRNVFAETWEQECSGLSAQELEEASEWARAHVPKRLEQAPFHIPDCGVWRYDLRRYLARVALEG